MICVAHNTTSKPSAIVHYMAYASCGTSGFQLLCDAPWVVSNSMCHARVVTEVDSLGRSMTVDLTRDPVDCVTCLVRHGR